MEQQLQADKDALLKEAQGDRHREEMLQAASEAEVRGEGG